MSAADGRERRSDALAVLAVLTVVDDADPAEAACRALLARRHLAASRSPSAPTPRPPRSSARREVDGMLVGAGHGADGEQVACRCRRRRDFAVAPGTDDESWSRPARELGLPFFPGVATPTEIGRARASGCTVVKVFPASPLGGPAFVAGVSARRIPTFGSSRPAASRRRRSASYLAVPPSSPAAEAGSASRRLLARRGASTRSSGSRARRSSAAPT